MLRGFSWLLAAAVTLSPLVPREEDPAEAVADHDRHPGLGHPSEGEGHHEHGDADDHHESPGSPCHHHDSHSCCTSPMPFALLGAADPPEDLSATRIHVPPMRARLQPFVVEFLHVPLA